MTEPLTREERNRLARHRYDRAFAADGYVYVFAGLALLVILTQWPLVAVALGVLAVAGVLWREARRAPARSAQVCPSNEQHAGHHWYDGKVNRLCPGKQ